MPQAVPCVSLGDGPGGSALVDVPGARALRVSVGGACVFPEGTGVLAAAGSAAPVAVPFSVGTVTLESRHPYENAVAEGTLVHMPGAARLRVTFAPEVCCVCCLCSCACVYVCQFLRFSVCASGGTCLSGDLCRPRCMSVCHRARLRRR